MSSCSPLPWQPRDFFFLKMQHQIKSTKTMLEKCLQSLKLQSTGQFSRASTLWVNWGQWEEWGGMCFWFSEAMVELWTLDCYIGSLLSNCESLDNVPDFSEPQFSHLLPAGQLSQGLRDTLACKMLSTVPGPQRKIKKYGWSYYGLLSFFPFLWQTDRQLCARLF